MSRIEDVLTATLVDRAGDPHVATPPLDQLRREISRAHRRRRALVAGSAAAMVAALVATGTVLIGPADTPAVVGTVPSGTRTSTGPTTSIPPPTVAATVPWSNSPARPNSRAETGYTLPTSLQDAPRCRADQLQLVPQLGTGAGTQYAALDVHNVGSAACAVSGRPTLELLDAIGRVWQSDTTAPASTTATPVVLLPNSWASTGSLAVADLTCGGDRTTTLRVTMPGEHASRTFAFPVGAPTHPDACAGGQQADRPHPGGLVVPSFTTKDQPAESFAALRAFTVTLDAPGSVRAGSTLQYSALLRNTTAATAGIGASPCPLYDQRVAATPTAGGTYVLSCQPADRQQGHPGTQAPPGQAIRFLMRLRIPADAPLGPTTLTWRLVEPDEPAVTANLTITH